LNERIEIECVDVQFGTSCLLVACSSGHVDVAKFLLEQGGERLLMLVHNVSCSEHALSLFLACKNMPFLVCRDVLVCFLYHTTFYYIYNKKVSARK
jgi:hypothetical protein